MTTFADQPATYRSELAEAQANGHEAVARKLEQKIQELAEFQQRHPKESEAPSALEVFCDLNPSNPNCRVYDD